MIAAKFEGVEDVAKDLVTLGRESEDALERAMDVAGAEQKNRFRTEQLSGRTAGDMGLNRVTGNLWESLRNVTIVGDRQMVSELYNRGAQYWEVHQDGIGIKKRLRFEEDLEERGIPLYESEIERGLTELLTQF
jgi:hypothetical protein